MRMPAMLSRTLFPVLAAAAAAGACQDAPHVAPSGETGVEVTTVAKGLEHPWSLAFLPDGRMLVTERSRAPALRHARRCALGAGLRCARGRMPRARADCSTWSSIPAFGENSTIYLSYAEPAADGTNGTAVARARLEGGALADVRVIFRQQPKFKSNHHFGSRLVFARDGNLFVTTGERNSQRDKAQDLGTHIGKILRITPQGGVPADNPFVGRDGALPEIWSYGHRNAQGAALHPETGQLWETEHGPRGGDEINLPQAGKNYGWPVITYGREYSGPAIGEGTAKAGMEQPVHYWVPSIAPSGMVFHSGNAYPAWKGQLFVGALAATQLVRLVVEPDGKVVHEERIAIGKRVRDVREGPDGALYLVTDEDTGEILRVVPAR